MSYHTGHFGGRIDSARRSSAPSTGNPVEEVMKVIQGFDHRLNEEVRLRNLQDERIARLSQLRGGRAYAEPVGASAVGEVPRRVFGDDGAAVEFCKSMQTLYNGQYRRLILTSTLGSEIDISGGFTVDESVRQDILAVLEQTGQLYGIAGRFPMPTRKLTVPRLSTLPTAAFVAEGVEPAEADIDFGAVVWEAEEAGCYLLVPNQLLDDAASPGLGNWIASQLIRALVLLREKVLAKGTGAPSDGGIVGILESPDVTVETMASGETGFTNLGFKHLTALEAAVVDDGSDSLRYVLSRSVLKIIKDITGTAAGPIWHPPNLSQPPTLNGYPFVLTSQFPAAGDSAVSKKFLAFGNFRTGLLVGDRMDIQVAVSRDFKFSQRLTAFLALTRFDAHVIGGSESGRNPIAVLRTAAS